MVGRTYKGVVGSFDEEDAFEEDSGLWLLVQAEAQGTVLPALVKGYGDTRENPFNLFRDLWRTRNPDTSSEDEDADEPSPGPFDDPWQRSNAFLWLTGVTDLI